jgi:hypothetical protein
MYKILLSTVFLLLHQLDPQKALPSVAVYWQLPGHDGSLSAGMQQRLFANDVITYLLIVI